MSTATAPTGSLARVMMAAVLALALGLVLTQSAAAAPAKGVSIGDRTQAQKDLCEVSGGTFEVETTYSTVFRGQVTKTVTTCTGGKNPQTCTNTKLDTTCSKGFTLPPQDPRDVGRVDESQIEGMQTTPEPEVIVDYGSIDEGLIDGNQQSSGPAPLDPLPTDGSATDPGPVTTGGLIAGADLLSIDPLP